MGKHSRDADAEESGLYRPHGTGQARGRLVQDAGLIRCADCGSAMAFNKKLYRGSERYIYRCSRYANYGKEQCSTHSIPQETLEQVILADMRHYAKAAIMDERKLTSKLLSASSQERDRARSAKRQAIAKLQRWIDTIDRMIKQLFEEKVTGGLPLATFQKLLADYERERTDLEAQVRVMGDELQAADNTEQDVLEWVGLIKNCLSLESLDRETAYRLIDHITVSEKAEIDGRKQQDVSIKYNFVGCLDQ